jgi:hypothetical protein
MHDAIEERVQAYEQEILRKLAEMERAECQGTSAPQSANPNKAKMIEKRGEEPLRQALNHMSGVDLTGIDAIGVGAVQVVVSEYGPDLSRFPTEKQFVSHVTLAPNQPITGGKPMRKKKKRESASSHLHMQQPYGPGSLLPSDRAAHWRRRGRICHRPQAGHLDLQDAALGPALCR